jgi:hypothetical protein
MASSCIYDAKNPTAFPFVYKHPNGSTVARGHNVDGVCVFETSACQAHAHNVMPNGDAFTCCEEAPGVDTSVWLYMLVAFMIPYFWMQYSLKKRQAAMKAEGLPEEGRVQSMFAEGSSKTVKMLVYALFLVSIVALVVEASVMPKAIQNTLTPTDRAAQLAMDAFLAPVQEVFAFIEDAMVAACCFVVSCPVPCAAPCCFLRLMPSLAGDQGGLRHRGRRMD